MTLGDTLKLGYLECAGWNHGKSSLQRRSPSSPAISSPGLINDFSPDAELLVGGALNLDDSGQCRRGDRDRSFDGALEWTHVPAREVQKSGNVCFRVSKAAGNVQRKQKLHLVRTTRLEPRPPSRSTSRPPIPEDKAEKIIVTEADLRRCGNSLSKLRQCQVVPNQNNGVAAKAEMEVSFKSAFAKRCRSQDHAPRNPWREMKNPEQGREHTEGDLILNQVWVDAGNAPEKKNTNEDEERTTAPRLSARSRQTSTLLRAASADAVADRRNSKGDSGEGSRGKSRTRRTSRGPNSARTPPSEGTSESHSRRSGHASGCPRPSADQELTAKPKNYESRIQLVEPEAEDDAEINAGSLAVRAAARMQRRFERRLEEEELYKQGKPRAVWVRLDPLSGEVINYPQAAATRLEAAHHNNRANVPFSGLGGDLEEDMVHLGFKGKGERPVQKSWHGTQMDVRRIEVPNGATELSIHVMLENSAWRISDCAVPGQTEERRMPMAAIQTVREPSPPLPPVNPDRRVKARASGNVYFVFAWCGLLQLHVTIWLSMYSLLVGS